MAPERPHGRFLAGEAGDLVGVSGTTIGQWARRGYIRASRSTGDPHVYSLEDVAEAWVVRALLERGVGHAAVRRTIEALGDDGPWPLLGVPLATTDGEAPRIVLCSPDGVFALSGRGWQRLAVQPPIRALRPPGAIGILVPGAGGDGATNGRRSSSTGPSGPDA